MGVRELLKLNGYTPSVFKTVDVYEDQHLDGYGNSK